MRVTNQMMVNNVFSHVQDILSALNETNERVASQKSFQKPSDDPVNASRSLELKSSLVKSKAYQETAALVDDWMEQTDYCLTEIVDLATKANSLILSGINDTMDDDSRTALANELTEMINEVVDIGNTEYLGNYIFSGVNLSKAAFTLEDDGTLTYNGVSKNMTRNIGQSNDVILNINGDEAISPLIEVMITARDCLASNDMEGLSDTLDLLDNALDNLVTYQTANGARMSQVENWISSMENAEVSIKALLSQKEDTDMVEAAAILDNQEETYQVVLEVGNRTLSALNLFDYLQ